MVNNTNDKKFYKSHITGEQKEVFVAFYELHPELTKNKLTPSFTNEQQHKLLEELQELLHACNGPKKTIAQWKICWRDLKKVAKGKGAELNKKMRTSGRGSPMLDPPTAQQSRINSLVGETLFTGLQNGQHEVGFPDNDDSTSHDPTIGPEHIGFHIVDVVNGTANQPGCSGMPTPSTRPVTVVNPGKRQTLSAALSAADTFSRNQGELIDVQKKHVKLLEASNELQHKMIAAQERTASALEQLLQAYKVVNNL